MNSVFSSCMDNKRPWVILCLPLVLLLSACSTVGGTSSSNPLSSSGSSNIVPDSPVSTTPLPFEYLSPLPNAQYVSRYDSIILRFGPSLTSQDASQVKISLQGSQSGEHAGRLVLADDARTLVFTPSAPFTPDEQVAVQINGVRLSAGKSFEPLSYTFSVAANQQPGAVASTAVPSATPQSAFPDYLTLPQDIPHYTVSVTSPSTAAEGDLFVAPFFWDASTVGSYLLILDNSGGIVYYQPVANQMSAFDFKVLPGGYITYFDLKNTVHVVMDSRYQVVGTYPAQNGYTADLHDFVMTPGGYVFLMAYDSETIDMSKLVPGGNPHAAVTGLVIQELDPHQNVIFEWRSWDHFKLSDSTVDMTKQQVDYVHGNGMVLASDGNLLISSRNLNEITKIDVKTGDILWRLGGKNSTFQFVNDSGFAYQHDIDVLSNGDITLFDNHGTDQAPTASRAVEYKLDLTNKTATMVWQYSHIPPVFTDFMGSVQRLSDGNTLIGWGNAGQTGQKFVFSSITEVTSDNQVVLELTFDEPYVSYRAFRAPWMGSPTTAPALAYINDPGGIRLGYSWNGASRVTAWDLYGGASPRSMKLLDQQAKAGFETQSYLANLSPSVCYFQAVAMDQNGTELARSAVISADATFCPPGP